MLHHQLRELWDHEPLSNHRDKWLDPRPDEDDEVGRALCRTGTHTFVAFVKNDLRLVAELDILMLRPQRPGGIVQGADIDNRLKTLFDALRYPENLQEIPTGWIPRTCEDHLFCLLEDDRLITRVNVDTDRLLGLTKPDEVELTIRVQVRASTPTWASGAHQLARGRGATDVNGQLKVFLMATDTQIYAIARASTPSVHSRGHVAVRT